MCFQLLILEKFMPYCSGCDNDFLLKAIYKVKSTNVNFMRQFIYISKTCLRNIHLINEIFI
jgi:hypothetical protein